MNKINLINITLVLLLLIGCGVINAQEKEALHWSELPPLPDKEGFAGMYAGVSSGALIVAGGANFPDKRPWEGGTKAWYNEIYILEKPNGQWHRAAATLPHPMAYGVSITYKNALICIGGAGVDTHFTEVLKLEWIDGAIKITSLPNLPLSMAYMAGALVGDMIYVAGGTSSPQANAALYKFLAMDLSAPDEHLRWVECEPWPGPERTLPVAASQNGAFYLVSGYRLAEEKTADGRTQPARVFPYLVDGYRYTPGRGEDKFNGTWQRIADMPRAAVGAPSPAPALGLAHFIVMGGIDTETAQHTDLENYPEFPHDILAYHVKNDIWMTMGQMPPGSSRLGTPATFWNTQWVIPSGEARPGIRSPKVYAFTTANRFGWLNWLALILYLVVMLGMGFYFSKRGSGTKDFFLAGGRIPWWAAGISIYGTQMSAITYMALPAIVFNTNWALALGSATIIAVAPLVIYFYLPFYRRLEVTTAYEFLELRFNLPVRLLGSLTFILFQFGRMGIVLFLPAIAISAVTGINIFLCIGLMGIICTLYTVMGGIEAVIWTDVIQVVILIGGALFCMGIIVFGVDGGFAGIIDIGLQDGKFALYNPGYSYNAPVLWVTMLGFFFLNLIPYTSDQTVVQRYLTTKDEAAARRSIWTTILIILPAIILFYGLGTALYAFYKSHPEYITAAKVDEILPWFIVQKMPLGFAGLIIAAIFAATMSTLDSGMNSIATAYINDVHRRLQPGSPDHAYLTRARWVTAMAGIIGTGSAMLIATFDIKYLFDYFQEILGLIGGSLAGVFILAIFTQRANALGAFIGTLAGGIVPWLVRHSSAVQIHPYLYGALGVLTCVAIGLLVSAATSNKKDITGLTIYSMKKQR